MNKLPPLAFAASLVWFAGCNTQRPLMSSGLNSTEGAQYYAQTRESLSSYELYEFRVTERARALCASGQVKSWEEAKKQAREEIAAPVAIPEPRKKNSRELTVAEMDSALNKTASR